MNSHWYVHLHTRLTPNGRKFLPSLFLFLALGTVLSLSGCVGLTGAGASAARPDSTSNSASSGTLAASATSLSFGSVTAGSGSSQDLTLTNTGTASITISQETVTGAGFSVVGGISSVVIATGQNHTFQVKFAPTSVGSASGGITIVSDAVDSPLSISLSGTGAADPVITAQPASETVNLGRPATFSVTATGTATLTYQWMKNGVAISGATSASYTTPATTSSDNGTQFSVTVANSVGGVTSNAANLTVNAATLVLNASQTSLSFGNVTIGNNSVLPVTFTNAGNSNVTVSNITVSGAGFTASGISSGQILTPGQTATLEATFAPSSAGAVNGNVSIVSDAMNSPAMISLSGTGLQPVSHSVTLTWTASASPVDGYNVYRGAASGGPYTKQNSSVIAAETDTDTAVQAGLTYYYVVTSVSSSGVESAYSNEVSAAVP